MNEVWQRLADGKIFSTIMKNDVLAKFQQVVIFCNLINPSRES